MSTSTNNNETSQEIKFEDFRKKYPHIADNIAEEAFKLFKENNAEFLKQYAEPQKENNSENDSKPNEGVMVVNEETPSTEPEKENTQARELEPWEEKVKQEYIKIYSENNVSVDPVGDGIHIEVAPHSKGNKEYTGTAISYHRENHVEIQTTKNGVKPKDQSFQHFMDHISVLKSRDFNEITIGNTQHSEFNTKLVAAVLNTEGISLSQPIKENLELNFSKEALAEIPAPAQKKLLEFALSNNVQLDFGENSPLLDFNNEAIKTLDPKLQYKYLDLLASNDNLKAQVTNAPKIEFYETKDGERVVLESKKVNVKNDKGENILDDKGNPKELTVNIYKPNPDLEGLSEEEIKTLLSFNREQQITELRKKTIGKDKSDKDITAGDAHDKINKLRNRDEGGTRTFKTDKGEEKTIKTINKEQRDANLAKLAKLRENAQNR